MVICQGVYNFCNPGAISHNEILDMYKKYIDPSFTYTNFTVEEQDKILLAGRSNNTLVRVRAGLFSFAPRFFYHHLQGMIAVGNGDSNDISDNHSDNNTSNFFWKSCFASASVSLPLRLFPPTRVVDALRAPPRA